MANVFIVEDDTSISRLIELALSFEGHTCRTFIRGQEALAALTAAERPDLIMLDLHLPDVEGITFVDQARANGFEGPLLVVTASSRQDAVVEALIQELGQSAVLLKPFDPDELVERVATLLSEGDTA